MIEDPTLEVVLLPAAELTEIEPALLAPVVLPGLWDNQPLSWPGLTGYFSGTHLVSVDKGAYQQEVPIPAAAEEALKVAVAAAVQGGRVWLINGTVSLLEEEVPPGFLNEHAQLLPPPESIPASAILPEALPAAWNQGEASADHVRGALSAELGRPLPWCLVRKVLDQGFTLGLLERRIDSAPWPCDLGGAPGVRLRVAQQPLPPPVIADPKGRKRAVTSLESHQVTDLADAMEDLLQATVGHRLRLSLTIELDREGGVSEEAVAGVNAVLNKIKPGWVLQ